MAVYKVKAAPGGYYDLVPMDIQIPVIDGSATARAIRALPDGKQATVPIIAITANAMDCLAAIRDGLKLRGIDPGTPIFVRYCRAENLVYLNQVLRGSQAGPSGQESK